MRIEDVTVGTVLKMIDGGGEYRVVGIYGDEVELASTSLAAGMDVYLSDLPEMFVGIVG